MNPQYISTRIINDYKPLVEKYGVSENIIPPDEFLLLCRDFYNGFINNKQFKKILIDLIEERK